MKTRYSVFISSTYKDLVLERAEVINELISIDHLPLGMEHFKASSTSSWNLIENTIKESDFYILITGCRYGTTSEISRKELISLLDARNENKDINKLLALLSMFQSPYDENIYNISITHKEYLFAYKHSKPIIHFNSTSEAKAILQKRYKKMQEEEFTHVYDEEIVTKKLEHLEHELKRELDLLIEFEKFFNEYDNFQCSFWGLSRKDKSLSHEIMKSLTNNDIINKLPKNSGWISKKDLTDDQLIKQLHDYEYLRSKFHTLDKRKNEINFSVEYIGRYYSRIGNCVKEFHLCIHKDPDNGLFYAEEYGLHEVAVPLPKDARKYYGIGRLFDNDCFLYIDFFSSSEVQDSLKLNINLEGLELTRGVNENVYCSFMSKSTLRTSIFYGYGILTRKLIGYPFQIPELDILRFLQLEGNFHGFSTAIEGAPEDKMISSSRNKPLNTDFFSAICNLSSKRYTLLLIDKHNIQIIKWNISESLVAESIEQNQTSQIRILPTKSTGNYICLFVTRKTLNHSPEKLCYIDISTLISKKFFLTTLISQKLDQHKLAIIDNELLIEESIEDLTINDLKSGLCFKNPKGRNEKAIRRLCIRTRKIRMQNLYVFFKFQPN